ncbi:hypothetical protein MUN88_00895 [Gracilibacillus caseinilyticus]|uniref:Uncharacterized protein n=1 Tax=Gracilibacillus caseinilyticus TaxID=2932256 RepID=A0ABY4EXI6_9BACI|nr:hypothetical protein [Gracilibacillus caseinilyticus]UOQ48751.1 hypothetical protein MUN88_00895 [Gracilibacillus caseinilyticus]
MLIERMKELGWKKLLLYSVIIFVSLVIIGFTIIFGGLLLLDQFDDRYQEPEMYETDN